MVATPTIQVPLASSSHTTCQVRLSRSVEVGGTINSVIVGLWQFVLDAKAAEAAQSAYYDPNRPQMAYVPPPAYYVSILKAFLLDRCRYKIFIGVDMVYL